MVESGCLLQEFVREQIAADDEWEEWLQVKDATPPQAHTRIAPPTDPIGIVHFRDEPSPNFRRSEELRARFEAKMRDLLSSGDWEVTGRCGSPPTRRRLEVEDVTRAAIDFMANQIGSFRDVRVERARAHSKTDVLTQFIEKVCLAAGNPGAPLKKDTIRELARHLCADNFSTNAFAAAWDQAEIDERWRRSGPR